MEHLLSNRTRRQERRQVDGPRRRDRPRNDRAGGENSDVDLPAAGGSDTPLLDAAGGTGVEVVSVPAMEVFRTRRDPTPVTTLAQGTEVTITGRRDGWVQLRHGRHDGFARDGQTEAQAAAVDGAGEAGAAAAGAGATILQLANDYNNIPIYAEGVSNTPSTSVRTPYVLHGGTTSSVKSTVENLVIAEGRPSAGQRVVAAASSQPWVGKGTPEQIQIIAQAVVDHGLATTGGLQAYMDEGVMRSAGRRNGKFGVDCSGMTGIAMAELEGDDREDGDFGVNAHGYRSDGWSGHTPVSPDQAEAGDVISYNTTNHVGVVYS
ncbi:MAG: cell wall-associated NlpC family hydrolase, partial [Myxococcota bacterium]